ncbi:hypothetical protein [Nonomuraea sp. NPDC046570]|uniref:hypothetical protein n=1 Tax=Nonomuraea sp. NPDC046570 TaxID=3155255 RepID=UPI0033F5220B
MTITEQDLRELLERDSGDGPYRGVAVAGVERRARRIRRRRGSALAAVAAAGAGAVAMIATAQPPVAYDWGGVLARAAQVDDIARALIAAEYERGGRTEEVTFKASGGRFLLHAICPEGRQVTVTINGREMSPRACLPGGVVWSNPKMLLRAGKNTMRVSLQVIGGPAEAKPYPARWQVSVAERDGKGCAVTVVPGEGKQVVVGNADTCGG